MFLLFFFSIPFLFLFYSHSYSQGRQNFAILASPLNKDVFYISGTTQPYADKTKNQIGISSYSALVLKGMPSTSGGPYNYTSATGKGVLGGTTRGSAPHSDSRMLTWVSGAGKTHLLMCHDGGINFKDGATLATTDKGEWGSLNGNLAIGELISVSYDPYADVLIAGAQV